MSTLELVIENRPKHSRLTVFFRPLLAIPHVVVVGVWSIFTGILTLIQWVRILVTGSRSESLWNKQQRWLSYATRIKSYQSYLFDSFPAFGGTPKSEPVTFRVEFEKDAKRLSALFRFLLAIPAYIILFAISIGANIVLFLAWFALMVVGRFPDGMHSFVLSTRQYSARVSAYIMYITDQYPKFS
jgi:hypothetical protein